MIGLRVIGVGIVLLALGASCGAWKLRSLDRQIEDRFRGRLFAVPSRVYSAPLVVFPGLDIERAGLLDRLHRLNYHAALRAEPKAGEFVIGEREIEIGLRPFRSAYREVPYRRIRLGLDDGARILSLRDARNQDLDTAEIEPELLAEFHDTRREDRRLVRLEEVPEHLIEAVLSIEDRRFYEHGGVHLSRVLGAAMANLRAGRVVQGGSTLTQQLVKNLYLSAERTLTRKLREAVMALLLERRHSKDEILEAYFNEVYMGQRGSVSIHGMGEAAHYYFAKSIGDLTPAESALLAGVIKGPALYSPYRHPERSRERRDLVLEVLFRDDRISREELGRALGEDLGVRGFEVEENAAPYFVEFLRQDLAEVYGEEILSSEGLSVFTTLDPHAQRVANRAVQEGLRRLEADFPPLRREDSPLQAALIALVPSSGEILALVGGRDYRKSQFNRATQARRQPGSVFKPIVALAALSGFGLERPLFTLSSKLLDEPLSVETPDGAWTPANYDQEFRGEVTLREAIEQSLNVPVARLGLEVGAERIIETARRMGIRSRLEPFPSIALGAFEVTLMEMAGAYAVLATGGVRPTLRSYAEVVDEAGRVLDHKPLDFDRVFEPAETFLVRSMLQGAVEHGTGRSLRRLGYEAEVAGKTGTTSGFRDAWFIGFSPSLLVAVWIGFDDGASLGIPGSVAALPIFADFSLELHGPKGESSFLVPAGLERVEIHRETGLRAGRGCPGAPEYFLKGTVPLGRCGPRTSGGVERVIDWLRGRL